MEKNKKPLGRKSYGSMAHLPNSRMGEGDHHISEGQQRIATEKARDKNDVVIVQEKLDGSNVGVAKINGEIIPISRAGYVANTSKYKQHNLFHKWVLDNYERFDSVLEEGERLCGEWLAQAHGTKYKLQHEPFVVFDLMTDTSRKPFGELLSKISGKFVIPRIIHIGKPISTENVMKVIGDFGFHGAKDKVEGAVWRVERNGEFDFICKWVRPDKKDGKYLESETGKEPIWNWKYSKVNGNPNTQGR